MQDAVVTMEVAGGPTMTVPWTDGMTVRDVLEAAYERQEAPFTYGLQYYGPDHGYLVMMINENYDSFDIGYAPDLYWSLRINGLPADKGIDDTRPAAGDIVTFSYVMRVEDSAEDPLVQAKHERRVSARLRGASGSQ
jgi:Domain of unknown function (DUF4430)